MAALPDPAEEIRLVSLCTLPGANYWSPRPVTRADLAVGAFDHISSADVDGFPDRILEALPGLRAHRCSIGRPGGFELRLRRGTYVPHILEHVALELQAEIGHDVGYGRARGGERAGEYTVVFEHLHAAVGRESAELGLEMIRELLGGFPADVPAKLEELRAAAAEPDTPGRPRKHVPCGVIGGGDRASVRSEILRRWGGQGLEVVDLSPADVLSGGLPYASARSAVILDASPAPDLPDRYRDPARVRRLYSVVVEAVDRGGPVVIPAGDPELERLVEEAGARPVPFSPRIMAPPAETSAVLRNGGIAIVQRHREIAEFPLHAGVPVEAQLAAAAAVFVLRSHDTAKPIEIDHADAAIVAEGRRK